MELKRLSHFAGNKCYDCEIVVHPTMQDTYIIRHVTERVITRFEKERIQNELLAQKNSLIAYNKTSDIEKIDSDLAKIAE